MSKQTNEHTSKETLETYKASVKLQSTKVHYRYALAIGMFLMLVVGIGVGFFVAYPLISEATGKVVNSIQIVSKANQ